MKSKLKIDRNNVQKCIDDLLDAGKRQIARKYNDIWDAERTQNAHASGMRQAVYVSEKSPSNILADLLEIDIANHLAWEVLWDNREIFKPA